MSGRFLVIGESGLDVFHTMRHERIAPDAPVLVGVYQATTYNSGMASNVVANLVSLGADHVDSILSDPPITKTRFVDTVNGQIVYRGDGLPPSDGGDRVKTPFAINDLRMQLDHTQYDCIVVSDYAKGYLTTHSMQQIAQEAANHGILAIADTKAILGEWSRRFDYVKINEREYNAQVKALGECPERFCEDLIVTFGKGGSTHFHGGELAGKVVPSVVPTAPVVVADSSGAGDTYCAAFVLMITKTGGDIATAMDYANRAARIAVSRRGVVAVCAEEVE